MTDYGLNLSAWSRDLDLYAAIPRLAEAGFRRCELWEEAVDLSAAATVERWRRLFDSHGVRAFAMHAPYKQDLASLNRPCAGWPFTRRFGALPDFLTLAATPSSYTRTPMRVRIA